MTNNQKEKKEPQGKNSGQKQTQGKTDWTEDKIRRQAWSRQKPELWQHHMNVTG